MTIKEIIERQNTTGELYLHRQGLFFRGYNQAAALLHEACGYQVLSKGVNSLDEALFYVGFPSSSLQKVTDAVRSRGGVCDEQGENLIVISDIELVYDRSALAASVKTPDSRTLSNGERGRKESALEAEIVGFDLPRSTPMDCMNFIARLQTTYANKCGRK